ncbi:MAG: glutamate--tRNA ligase [Deltaproteobacteria bacterium]|nr:glutamate--tRNA ligase [Deltaproteobacteria bacterium]MBW2121403.1 glutamate--tRNA ligase [Deltaproteobacteria bacterium]
MSREVRTRFPPSPTGYLHIGGARTALFNWLFARHYGGKFILRVEDTDVARSTSESVEGILESMRWLGLDWDEGPYFQSQRLHIYRDHVQRLLDHGKAYRCFCSPEELERKRKQAIKEKRQPKYDGTCRDLKPPFPDRPYAVRFRSPQEGKTAFFDLIKGEIVFENSELDDLIILRSDGMPTYNLAVVVDDATMGVTHVIRGDDHVNNTPRQILLFRAFDFPVPEFAHVPMILGPDKTRLSKRHGAQSVLAYRDMGYLPQGLMNYLVRLGWSYGDQEFFTVEEMIEKFTLDNVGTSPGMFDPEKLRAINGDHIKASRPEEIARLLIPYIRAKGYAVEEGERLTRIVEALKERAKTLVEMADQAEFWFQEKVEYEEKAAAKFLRPEALPALERLAEEIRSMENLDEQTLETMFRKLAEKMGVRLVKVAQPVRVALTGRSASPGLFEVMDILGKQKVLERLASAMEYIRGGEGSHGSS